MHGVLRTALLTEDIPLVLELVLVLRVDSEGVSVNLISQRSVMPSLNSMTRPTWEPGLEELLAHGKHFVETPAMPRAASIDGMRLREAVSKALSRHAW